MPVEPAQVESLIKTVQHRFEADQLKPEPPIHAEDAEHFNELMETYSDRLLVVDFFAPWCAPCKTLAPVFHQLSLQTPTARFIKVTLNFFSMLFNGN